MIDTIIAISTPIGNGAIGIIRISGPKSLGIVSKFSGLKIKKSLKELASHTVHLVNIFDKDPDSLIDEAMLTIMKAPNSYTGEDVIELSCHNNIHILNKIIELAIAAGARLAGPGEFTERAFFNGKLDLTQAEAVADIIHAESSFAEKTALKQLKGSITTQILEWKDSLLNTLAKLEVALDHEDILAPNLKDLKKDLSILKKDINKKIIASERIHKTCSGINIVLAGRPNVGKSSLLNTILDHEKAIVSDLPGTTRDPIETIIEHQNIKMTLIDTAGLKTELELKETKEKTRHAEIEKIGIRKTHEYLEKSDYIFFIIDLSTSINEYDLAILQKIKNFNKKIILLGNKQDKEIPESKNHINQIKKALDYIAYIKISAKNGDNIDKLLDICTNDFTQKIHPQEQGFMVNKRHKTILTQILTNIEEALTLIKEKEGLEFIAVHLHSALSLLDKILGIDTDQALLTKIFSTFCIGK